MALSRTNLLGSISSGGFGTGAYTTASFTPPNESLLCVAIEAIDDSGSNIGTTLTINDSAGLTWTQRIAAANSTAAYSTATQIYTAPVTTGTSMTITLDAGALNINEYCISVVAYTGYNTGSPVGATASKTQTGGFTGPPDPVNMTLSAAPASTSEVFAAVGADRSTAGVTPGSGWTEIHDNAVGFGGMQTQIRTGSTSTSVDWVDIRAGGGSLFNYAAVAIEVLEGTPTTTASAGNAAGTGTAADATPGVSPAAGAATGTGTAHDATVIVSPVAGVAAGTGTAYTPTPGVGPAAAAATGTGAASAAVPGVAAAAGAATGTGTAPDAIGAGNTANPAAGHASGTGAAYDATVTTQTVDTGSWGPLLALVREARTAPRIDPREAARCPNDGTVLLPDPRGHLRCPFDGYRR